MNRFLLLRLLGPFSGLGRLRVRHITLFLLRFFSLFYLNLEFFGLIEEYLVVVGLLDSRYFRLLVCFLGVDTLISLAI